MPSVQQGYDLDWEVWSDLFSLQTLNTASMKDEKIPNHEKAETNNELIQ